MYVTPNFKSKAAVKRAIAKGEPVKVISNSPFDTVPHNGTVSVEGPHYPASHTWYGEVIIVDGIVARIR
jgi:hypothetical protein